MGHACHSMMKIFREKVRLQSEDPEIHAQHGDCTLSVFSYSIHFKRDRIAIEGGFEYA